MLSQPVTEYLMQGFKDLKLGMNCEFPGYRTVPGT